MKKLNIWGDIHLEIDLLKKLVDPNLTNSLEAVALTVYRSGGQLTKKEILDTSGTRKQRVSFVLKKLVHLGYLVRNGRGVKRDAFRYSWK